MRRMNKTFVRSPQFEDVCCHQQKSMGQRFDCQGQATGEIDAGNGYQQGNGEKNKQCPPLDAPRPTVDGDDEREQEGEAEQQQAGHAELLEHLVAEVPVALIDGFPQVSGKQLAIVPLGGKPATALTGEIVGVLYLLVEHEGFGEIMEMFALIEKCQFQFAVETSHGFDIYHRVTKQVVAKCHA